MTALDSFNNLAVGYTGTVHFTSSDNQAGLPAAATLAGGTGSFAAILRTAGSRALTVTDGIISSIAGSSTVVVAPAAPTRFLVAGPSAAVAGSTINITVTALDPFGNITSSYGGTVDFSSSAAIAALPAARTLTNGMGTFNAVLKTSGLQTLAAIDSASTALSGSMTLSISAAAATHFTVSAAASITAGNALVVFVTAQDSFGNTASGYNGTVHFSSTDSLAQLPADATLTAGVGIFAVIGRTAGNQTFDVADTNSGTLSGVSGPVVIKPGAVNHFGLSVPAAATTGAAVSFTVTALDPFNNLVPSYAGTVQFSSSDASATLPSSATLTAGSGIFTVTLQTPGSQTLTAADVVSSGISATSNAIAVRGLVVTSLTPTSTGFVATFSKAFNASVISLYDGSGNAGPDDVLLAGPGMPQDSFHGSLLIDPTDTTITFVKTSNFTSAGFNPATGVLAVGTYTVTFRSASNGFTDQGGVPLDGADDGTPGGNYVATFVVAAEPVVVGLPAFARGPGNTVNLPNTAAGIPINLSNGAGVTSGTFTLQYNSALLSISGATAAVAGATFSLDASSTPGNAVLDFSSPTALGAGIARLGELTATVPNSAAASYKGKALLHFTAAQLNGGAIAVTGDDAVEVVAWFGNASGDGTLSGGDASAISLVATGVNTNTAVGTLSGFSAFPLADPVILADLNNDGLVDASDVTLLNSLLSGTPRAQIPLVNPNGLTIIATGPDPTLSVAVAGQAIPGSTVTAAVNIDTARPAGSTGMTEAILALHYDPLLFTVSAVDVQLGTLPQRRGWLAVDGRGQSSNGRDRH